MAGWVSSLTILALLTAIAGVNLVIEPLVANPSRLDMRSHLRPIRKQRTGGHFGCVGDRMAAAHWKAAIHLKMEFDKHSISCIARAQIVHSCRPGAGQHYLLDAVAVFTSSSRSISWRSASTVMPRAFHSM